MMAEKKETKRELRQLTTEIDLRQAEEGKEVIEGYALKFERWSDTLGHWFRFREKLDKDCLRNADLSKTTALFNHNENKILGRNGVNLELEIDNIGLRFKVSPIDTTYAKDLMENIRAGVINQCSFAFSISIDDDAEEWRESETEPEVYERTIKKIDTIYDVSIVTTPAYPDTEAVVGTRSKEEVDKIINRSKDGRKEIEKLILEAEAYS